MALKTFHLTIARVGEIIFDGEASSVVLPGREGVFEVLAGHEALVSPLVSGVAQVKTQDGVIERYEMPDGGVAEVSGGQASVLL